MRAAELILVENGAASVMGLTKHVSSLFFDVINVFFGTLMTSYTLKAQTRILGSQTTNTLVDHKKNGMPSALRIVTFAKEKVGCAYVKNTCCTLFLEL